MAYAIIGSDGASPHHGFGCGHCPPPGAMEGAVVGVVLDSSILITAERKNFSVSPLVEATQIAYGEIELSLSPVTVAELVHGIYRAGSPEASRRRSR